MTNLDHWLAALGDDATYGPEAAARLEGRLALELSPRVSAGRRGIAGSAAFAVTAVLAGAAMGAFLEVRQSSPTSAMLPASDASTTSALLFGPAG